MYKKQAGSSNFERINNLITFMFDCLHGRNFKVNENIKNESIAVFSENVLVYSWLSCPNTELNWLLESAGIPKRFTGPKCTMLKLRTIAMKC